MKTTVEISDWLLREARKLAARKGVTLRSLIESGLRQTIAESKRHSTFKLRRASFKGKGLRSDFRHISSARVRDLAYEGRGGRMRVTTSILD
jgi:hypothetical protein